MSKTARTFACLLALVAVSLSACDSDSEGNTAFTRLQGTWERTDAGFTDETVRFGPGQSYTFRRDGAVVETGLYATAGGGTEGEREVTVQYLEEGTGQRIRPDEAVVLAEGTLVLTPSGGPARSYRRD